MYNLKEMLVWGTFLGFFGICLGFVGGFFYGVHVHDDSADNLMNIMWISGGIWAFVGVLLGTPVANSRAFLMIILTIVIVVLIIDYVIALYVIGTLVFSYFKRG